MHVQLHGGVVEVASEEDIRLLVACLPTKAQVAAAKRAMEAEREATGLVIDADGRILGQRVRRAS